MVKMEIQKLVFEFGKSEEKTEINKKILVGNWNEKF